MRNVNRMRLDPEQRLKIASFQFKGVFRLQFPLPTKSIQREWYAKWQKTRQAICRAGFNNIWRRGRDSNPR